MPGGPVNGVPWTALVHHMTKPVTTAFGPEIAEGAQPILDPNHPVAYTGIIVPTVLQLSADMLSYWTSMTCLYDRYWTAEADRVTLPICMFHVKKCTPVRTIETSKKRVILYEPQKDERLTAAGASDQMRQSVMQTIIDNAVKLPTTYNLDIIVPFQPIGRYVSEGLKIVTEMLVALSDLMGGNPLDNQFTELIASGINSLGAGQWGDQLIKNPLGYINAWQEGFVSSVFSSVFSLLKTANTASELVGKLPGMDGVSYLNMNSLEAMAESCRTLCMKMWTGYHYAYAMITNMQYDKNPTEDDVFRATLTLTEMPVLAVSRPKSPKPAPVKRNWAVSAITASRGALVTPLIALTGVENAAGGGESGVSMIKDVLGV